jgi:hypothetical protein
MIYKSKDGDINLLKVTRMYPAAVIEMYGEIAEMSLEWIEDYGEKVKLMKYILVFDFTPIQEEIKIKKVLDYETRDELIFAMTEVARLLKK